MFKFLVTLFLLDSAGMGRGATITPPTMAPPSPVVSTRRYLDDSSLYTLNTEVKNALMTKMVTEKGSINAMMASLNPELAACDVKVNNSYTQCLPCLDTTCHNRFQRCNRLVLKMYSPGGVSVQTMSSFNGHHRITLCYSTGSMSQRTCSTIFNPRGFTVNSVSQVNNDLTITMSKSFNQFSGNSGIFISNGGIVRNMTDEERAQLQQQMQNLQHNLQNMGHNIQQNVQQSMQQMNNGLQQTFSNMGQHMNNFGNTMSQWAQGLSHSLSHMFDGTFLGKRRRRAAGQSCTFFITDLMRNCPTLTQRCASCPGNRRDMMEAVCDRVLMDKLRAMDKSSEEISQISDEVSNVQNIVTQVQFDENMLDPVTAGYVNVDVTANIRGMPTVLQPTTPLILNDPVSSAAVIADQIWKEWLVHMSRPYVL